MNPHNTYPIPNLTSLLVEVSQVSDPGCPTGCHVHARGTIACTYDSCISEHTWCTHVYTGLMSIMVSAGNIPEKLCELY